MQAILLAGNLEGPFMASPINRNSVLSDVNTHRLDGVNTQQTNELNIPNSDQNHQWFLSENTGSRAPITLTNNPLSGINAAMGVDAIANQILTHVGA